MRTSKCISTISYNSEEYLISKLNELYKNHKISDWFFVKHAKEEDENKDHIHLWIKPNTLLDTMSLQEFFKEMNIQNPAKPFGCIDFRNSSTDDAILYFSHFEPYLATKYQARKYHYTKDDFTVCDSDSFEELWRHAYYGSDFALQNQRLKAIYEGMVHPADLIFNGSVPLQQASQLNALMYMSSHKGMTDRNGRRGHDYMKELESKIVNLEQELKVSNKKLEYFNKKS